MISGKECYICNDLGNFIDLKRKFITNLALLLILNLLVKPFWVFGIDRSVQNAVGAQDYGLYFSLFSFSVILNILLDIGITNFNNRSIAQNPSILPEYFSKIVPLKFLLAIFYSFIIIIAGLLLGYSSRQFHILYFLILNNFLLSFILYIRSNISGLQLFRTDSLLSVLDRCIMSLICSLLLWGHVTDQPLQIEWFVYAQTFSYLLTLIIALLLLISRTGSIRLDFNMIYGREILRNSYPYALLILLMSFFSRIDSVMLERMLPDGKMQAGIYAQAFRLLDAAVMFAFLFTGLLLPMFSRMLKQGEKIAPLLKLSFSLLFVPAVILSVVSVFYAREIMGWLYYEHVDISSKIFIPLILSYLFITVTYIFGTLLTAGGNLRQLNILAFTSVLLNLALNLILIPRYQALGSAYACIISQGFFAVSQIFLTRRIFALTTHYIFLFRITVFACSLFISGILIHKLILPSVTGLLILGIMGILYSWILKIITPREVMQILRATETPSA